MSEVTRILSAIEQGDPHAAEQLLPLVYDELRQLAAQKLAQEKPGQTLQPTAGVESFRFFRVRRARWLSLSLLGSFPTPSNRVSEHKSASPSTDRGPPGAERQSFSVFLRTNGAKMRIVG
jgi:hypothetical protein